MGYVRVYIYYFKLINFNFFLDFFFQVWDFKQLHTYLRMLQQLFYVSIA
jgi:hypothetical protein